MLVVAGLVCQEVGASIAVLLFPEAGPLGMVLLRLGFSALILLAVTRPRLGGHSRRDWGAVGVFGFVLAAMNGLFYLALERLPLGVTVTIEVLGPLALAIATGRRVWSLVWAALARDQLANALIEATLPELPEAYRPAAYTVAFDATPLPEFARGVGRSRKNALGPNEKLSSEPEAGFYVRHTEDHADDGSQPMTKVKYAFELDILVGMHPDPHRTKETPMLALGIAHHKPGEMPGANALKVLEGTLKRGHVIKEYIADRAYLPGAKVEDLHRHLFDHGIAVVMDYKRNEFGIQAQHEGMILVDGRWYSPSMLEELRNLGAEWAAARERHDSLISRGKPSTMPDFTDRFELRAMYEFRPKEKPDKLGNTPMVCPAARPNSTVWCPLKAFLPAGAKFPIQGVPVSPGKACTNKSSIALPRDADGGRALKYRQDFAYGTREWQLHYGRRNLVESFNWSIKGESGINLHVASNRRVRGATSKYLFAAVGVAVANLGKIQKFVHQKERDEIDEVLEKVGMAPMVRSGKSGRYHQLVHRRRVEAQIREAHELAS
ncbi:EamA family transporter [Microbacterium lacticum]|nr:hypothetical protein [Microbacterium lacticum]